MTDTLTITTNVTDGSSITSSVADGATIQTTVTEGTAITAQVVTGAKGDKGDTGATGEQGAAGPTGATGPAGADGADGVVQSIVAGTNVTVDNTDPANPIVSSTGGSGSGDVTGPGSSVDGNVVLFDGTTGNLIKDSGVTISGNNTGDQDLSSYVQGQASSVDSEVALFSGTDGKTIKRASGSGIAKLTSGVLSTATSGTDYSPATSGSSILKGNGTGGFSSASQGTDYYAPSGTDVAVADGGTGRSTGVTAYGLIAAGTTATGAQQTISPGTSGQFLKSAGASSLASFASIAESDVTNLTSDLAAKAPLASPTFTGTPAAPTASAGTSTTQLATTAFVDTSYVRKTRTVNGHALSSDVTVTADDVLPSQNLNSGKFLTTNGSTASWSAITTGVISWSTITANTTASAYGGYVVNSNTELNITLPSSASFGDIIWIIKPNDSIDYGDGGWKIVQPNSGTQISFGNTQTTLGTSGYLESTSNGDVVQLMCFFAGSSPLWQVISSIGNITVV